MRVFFTILAVFPLALTTARGVHEPPDEPQKAAHVTGLAPCPDAPSDEPATDPSAPQKPWSKRPSEMPVARQLMPDSHAGGTRAPLNARLLLRLPGLAQVPGLHNHRLEAWLEWQMAQARCASSSMEVVASTLQPHAPPRLD